MARDINPTSTSIISDAANAFSTGVSSAYNTVSGAVSSGWSSLTSTVESLSGGAGSSGVLNGATAGADPRGVWDDNLGEYTNIDAGLQGAAGGVEWSDDLGEYVEIPSSSVPGLDNIIGNIASSIPGAASFIADAAGAVNDFVSSLSGKSLPTGAELFTGSGTAVSLNSTSPEDWRVRVKTEFSYFGGASNKIFSPLIETDGVVFPILPNVSFSSMANYTNVDPTHNNYPFPAYKNSSIGDISIGGVFPVETQKDAAYWISAVTFFKTMTKMFFGEGQYAGNPPPVCYLYGYGAHMFDKIPVVVKNFSLDLGPDVNYIKCSAYGSPTWVPVSSTLNISLQPIYNRTNLRKFNLKDYSSGNMVSPSGVNYL